MTSNSSAVGPSVVELPLPPGMSLEQFFYIRNQFVIIGIIAVVILAITVWDYLVLFRHEIRNYRRSSWRELRKQPTFWAFTVLRYSIFIAKVPAIWFTTKETKTLAGVSQIGVVLVTASSGVIFSYRVTALWNNSMAVRVMVGVLYVLMVSSWIASATQFKTTTGPPGSLLAFSNCKLVSIPRWTAISYTSSVVFDVFVVVATALKLSDAWRQSPFGQRIYADSLLYFAAVTTINVVALAVQSLPKRHQGFKPMVIPWSGLITSALAQRVYLNLKLFNIHSEGQSGATVGDSTVAPGHVNAAHLSTHVVVAPDSDLSLGYSMERLSSSKNHFPP